MNTVRRPLTLLVITLALFAGACTPSESTIVMEDATAANDGGSDEDFSTEFDPVDAQPAATATPEPTPADPPPGFGPTPSITPSTPPPPITPSVTLPDEAALPPRPPAPPVPGNCGTQGVSVGPKFVWNVDDDDPDGGLVAHIEPDVDSPITRVLPPNSAATRETGRCELAPNGKPWIELVDADGNADWVNAAFLAVAYPSCLHGEANGTNRRDGAGDVVGRFGPIDGLAIIDDDRVAFFAISDAVEPPDNPVYLWYPIENAPTYRPCFGTGPTGTVCLSGDIRLFVEQDPEQPAPSNQPREVVLTGRTYFGTEIGSSAPLVQIEDPQDRGNTVWYDARSARTSAAPCGPEDAVSGSFDELACTVGGAGTDDLDRSAGSDASQADHVHAMRRFDTTTADGETCHRLVFELGTDVWTPGDEPATLLPAIAMTGDALSTRFVLSDCGWEPGCPPFGVGYDEPHRVELPGMLAFVARDADGAASIEILHHPGRRNVTFLERPARIVFDVVIDQELVAALPSTQQEQPWVSGNMTLREPIQPDVLSPGLEANEPFAVSGWGRPFEAQGQWRVYRLDESRLDAGVSPGDLELAYVNDMVEENLVDSGLFMTSGWAESAGAFRAEVPGLAPGLYAVLMGDTPPTDDGGYVATGQAIRVADPEQDAETPLPVVIWSSVTLDR